MRILVKIGGAQLEETGPRAQLCQAIAAARKAGHEVIVVHGGGNQIRQLGKDLGIEERYHEGLRITDVAALQRAGVPSVGISGADGGSFAVRPLVKPGVDLGFVGKIDIVRPQLVLTLLQGDFVPVIATVAPGVHGDASQPFFNINADHAAAPLCKAFACEAMIFLTDVDGVRGKDGTMMHDLTPTDCDALIKSGIATGGMIPKLEAALLALKENPNAMVKIAPAGQSDAVLAALRSDVGTTFHQNACATTED